MRLNQLAKKVGKPYTRVEKFIRKDLNIEGIQGPNSRINEEIANKVISKFGLFKQDLRDKSKVKLQTVEAKPAEISAEDRGLEDINLDYAIPAESVVPNLEGLGEKTTQEISSKNNDEVDNSKIKENNPLESSASSTHLVETENSHERVISETLETEETVLHIDQNGTIIAPKVELEGIKIRGKIDIPGVTDQIVDAPEEVELTQEEKEYLKKKEDQRIKDAEAAEEAKRKKIDQDAAKILALKEKREHEEKEVLRLQIEKEREKKKKLGKKHYLNTVKQVPKPTKSKKKKSIILDKVIEKNKSFETKEKFVSTDNMTAWQRIVRWFNT